MAIASKDDYEKKKNRFMAFVEMSGKTSDSTLI